METRMKKLALAVLLVVFGISNVYAQEAALKKETIEIGIFSDAIEGDLVPFIGYFVSDNLELALHFNFVHAEIDLPGVADDIEQDSFIVSFDVLSNLPTGTRFVPVVGAGVNFSRDEIEDETTETVGFDLTAGVRYFIAERGAVTLFGQYEFADIDFSDDIGTITADGTAYAVGLLYSIFFQ
ncbi:porin family protein [Nitrospiraceae bacterium HYJII51-Mn-bac16s-1-B09]|uniref:Porin family protein n=2 Tax=Candidatus Manganitrophus noduliformans TaxID=2606439 RepID=A0A7X6IA97_9BACT|nr:porin family protein [Candidatus Manganitrophus noduliformans]